MMKMKMILALFLLGTVRVQGDGHKYGEAGDTKGSYHYLKEVNLAGLAAHFTKDSGVYSLGFDQKQSDPAFGFRQCVMIVKHFAIPAYFPLTYHDDFFFPCANGIGSQLDGLGHIGVEGVFYNGLKAEDIKVEGTLPNAGLNETTGKHSAVPELDNLPKTLAYSYLSKMGTDEVAEWVTRGIVLNMLDLPSLADRKETSGGVSFLKEGTGFTKEHVDEALAAQGLDGIRTGDVVLFHTGWKHLYRTDSARFLAGEPGPALSAVNYLIEKKVSAMGADQWAFECLGADCPDTPPFPVHMRAIKESGTYLLENMDTHGLIADGVHEFVFVLGGMKNKGSIQTLINPVAIGGSKGTKPVAMDPAKVGVAGDELGAYNYMANVDLGALAKHLNPFSKYYGIGLTNKPTDVAFGVRQNVMMVEHFVLPDYHPLTYHDDFFLPGANGVGSQLDGLGHCGVEGVYYNGFKADDMIMSGTVPNSGLNVTTGKHAYPPMDILPANLPYSYLKKLGTDKIATWVTRAVVLNMLDLPSIPDTRRGETPNGDRFLKAGTGFTEDHIKEAEKIAGVTIGQGDVVLLHTGWKHKFTPETGAEFLAGEPGPTVSAAKYLQSKKVSAIGTDSWALECLAGTPDGPDPDATCDDGPFPVHQQLLPQGTPILENMDTHAMIADNVVEGIFVLGGIKIEGSVQTLINPIVISSPRGTIVQTATAVGMFNTLLAAAKAAGLVDALSTMELTVMAPMDTAFAKAFEALGVTAEQVLAMPELGDILKYHAVAGRVLAKDVSDGMEVTTLQEEKFTVGISDKGATITGGAILPSANIVATDISCTNGIIHVIDAVLIPPSISEALLAAAANASAATSTTAAPAPASGGTSDVDTAAATTRASGLILLGLLVQLLANRQ